MSKNAASEIPAKPAWASQGAASGHDRRAAMPHGSVNVTSTLLPVGASSSGA